MDTNIDSPSWLPLALRELEEACAAAKEEGYARVTELALSTAKDLLHTLSTRVREEPMIDPTPEGGIGMDFRSVGHNGVLLVIDADGSGLIFEQIGEKMGRGRYSDAHHMLEAAGWGALKRAELL